MSETPNLKIVAPDASSVLVPLHAHFKGLADTVEQAIVDRFQVKNLSFENLDARIAMYEETTGLPKTGFLDKPALVDGDICYVKDQKRYFIWNKNPVTSNWMQVSKRLNFATTTARDGALGEDLAEGDTCYCNDVDTEYTWSGAAWVSSVTSGLPKAVIAGQFYGAAVNGTSQTTQVNDRIYYTSFYVPKAGSYDAYNVSVVTGQASSSITFGLYRASESTGLPTTLVAGTTCQAATTSSTVLVQGNMTSSVSLNAGWYWIACFVDWTGTGPTLVATSITANGGGGYWMPKFSGYQAAASSNAELFDGTNTANTPGTMPANAGSISASAGSSLRSPYVAVRRSA
jgi:hypothetical protein